MRAIGCIGETHHCRVLTTAHYLFPTIGRFSSLYAKTCVYSAHNICAYTHRAHKTISCDVPLAS